MRKPVPEILFDQFSCVGTGPLSGYTYKL